MSTPWSRNPPEPPPIFQPPPAVEPPPIVQRPAGPVEPPPIQGAAMLQQAAAGDDPPRSSRRSPLWLATIVLMELLAAGFAGGGIAAILVNAGGPRLQIDVLLPEEISEHDTLRLVIPAEYSGYASGQITYGASDAPDGFTVDQRTGVVTWTPNEEQGPGTYRIVLKAFAAGPSPRTAERELVVRVAEVNDPPIIRPIGEHTIRDDGTLRLPIEVVDPDAVHANGLKARFRYRAFSVGEWVVPCKIDPVSGVFRFEPDPGARTYTFEVWVEKLGPVKLAATQTFRVHVTRTVPCPVKK
jgi:hypothetical protein